MDKQLYNKLIQSISKGIKKTLNEEIQNFDVTDYNDDEQDIINNQTISDFMGFDYSKFNDLVDMFNNLNIPEETKNFLQPIFSIIIQGEKGRQKTEYYFYYDKNIEFDNINFLKKVNKLNKKYEKTFSVQVSFFNSIKKLSFIEREKLSYKIAECTDFVFNFIYYNSNVNSLVGTYTAPHQGYQYYKTNGRIEPAYFSQTFYPQSDTSRYQWQIQDIDDGAKNMYEFIRLYIEYIEKNIDKIKRIQ